MLVTQGKHRVDENRHSHHVKEKETKRYPTAQSHYLVTQAHGAGQSEPQETKPGRKQPKHCAVCTNQDLWGNNYKSTEGRQKAGREM